MPNTRLFGAALVFLFATAFSAVASAEERVERETGHFLTTKKVPPISSWSLVRSTTLSGRPDGLFLVRYFSVPEESKTFGPLGMTVSLREVPEAGVLYQAWNIKERPDGTFDFAGATFAHYQDSGWWAVAKPGFSFSPLMGPMEPTSYRVYKTVIVYRPESHQKMGGRQKMVVEYEGVERYGRKTLRQVLLKLLDPDGKAVPWWVMIEFAPKDIQEREKLK